MLGIAPRGLMRGDISRCALAESHAARFRKLFGFPLALPLRDRILARIEHSKRPIAAVARSRKTQTRISAKAHGPSLAAMRVTQDPRLADALFPNSNLQ